MPILYNLRLLAPNHYAMGKFDEDFNVAAIYNLTPRGQGYACDCPAGQRSVKLKPCKHQRMLPYMVGAVNTERFYDPETRLWHQPLQGFRNGDGDGLPDAAPVGAQAPIPLATPPSEVVARPVVAATPIITRRI